MPLRSQVQTVKLIRKEIGSYKNIDLFIKNVLDIITSRQDINEDDYRQIVEYMILELNCNNKITISDISKIANVFRNYELENIEKVNEAFLNIDGKLPVNIGLDKDGSLLVNKHISMDYAGVFAQSHRLIKMYQSVKNVDGVKYELCKQWFLLYLLENKVIYNKNKLKQMLISDAKKKEAIQIRSFILSDYKVYMKWVNKNDPNFNFNEYFKTTPFYKETFKIDKRLIQCILPL